MDNRKYHKGIVRDTQFQKHTLVIPNRAMRSAQRTVRRLHEVNQSIQLTETKKTGGVSFEDYGEI